MLVKYKDVNDYDRLDYIVANMHDNPSEILKLVKEIDAITIKDKFYTYVDNEFRPSVADGILDVLYIYIEEQVY